MAWLALTLRMPAEAYPRAEALLELAGASSISISDAGDSPILEPAPGTVPLWPRVTVRALFPEDADRDSIGAILGPIGDSDLSFAPVADDALASGGEPVPPQDIGPRLAIVPADALDPGDERALGLHMGLAFGTGRHPTTRLCLEWLEREMPPCLRVLDYGTGSGVLALAALKLGAREATATDNEPQALRAARQNAVLNGLEDSIRIVQPDALPEGDFDLILANILARPLIELAERFAAGQGGSARIVLSGLLQSQIDAVESRYLPWYADFERRSLEGWALLTARRRNGYDP